MSNTYHDSPTARASRVPHVAAKRPTLPAPSIADVLLCEHPSCFSVGLLASFGSIDGVFCRRHWATMGINIDAPRVYVDHGGFGELAIAGRASYSFGVSSH